MKVRGEKQNVGVLQLVLQVKATRVRLTYFASLAKRGSVDLPLVSLSSS